MIDERLIQAAMNGRLIVHPDTPTEFIGSVQRKIDKIKRDGEKAKADAIKQRKNFTTCVYRGNEATGVIECVGR